MILNVKDLVKRYGEETAIDHLDLSIDEGEIFGLLGPNGAGKTTLINSVLGLTKTESGHMEVLGKKLASNGNGVKKEIGVVPQDLAIYEDLTAYENVDLFASLYGLKGQQKKERVEEALEFVGLADKKKQYPKKFSGGMKRRLNIAMAIVHQPKLVIMDEPTVGIDPQSRNQILESVKTLNQRGITIIYTSHYMEEVEAICTRIAIMDRGRIIARGTKEELKQLIDFEEKGILLVDRPGEGLKTALKAIEELNDVEISQEGVTLTWGKGNQPLTRIMRIVDEQGYQLKGLKIQEPNLENVFLTLTGKTLRD